MQKLLLTLVFFVSALTATVTAQTQLQRERIQSSYLLAFGRAATDAEVVYWSKQSTQSIAELITGHRRYLKQDVGTHRAAIRRSYIDALGREPIESEYKHWLPGDDTYTQLMKNHISWLRGNPAEYEKVIRRSYRLVLNRKPDGAEIKYWKGQGTLSYAMLSAAHDWWKKQNPPASTKAPSPAGTVALPSGALKVSSGSTYLATATVSPSVAAEARSAAGLVGNDGASLVGNDGASMVAAGGGNLVAAGGGNLVAAGGGNLVAATGVD